MSRLGRFLHLERSRPEGDAAPPAEQAAQDARFRPPPVPSLELDLDTGASFPALRCMNCESDSNRNARACGNCGASLLTPEQHAFNASYWEKRLDDDRRLNDEAAQIAVRRAEDDVARREAVVKSALAMGEEARAARTSSVGMTLLRLIPDLRARVAVALALFAIPLILLWKSPAHSSLRLGAGFALFILVVLFVPPAAWAEAGRRRRRRFFW